MKRILIIILAQIIHGAAQESTFLTTTYKQTKPQQTYIVSSQGEQHVYEKGKKIEHRINVDTEDYFTLQPFYGLIKQQDEQNLPWIMAGMLSSNKYVDYADAEQLNRWRLNKYQNAIVRKSHPIFDIPLKHIFYFACTLHHDAIKTTSIGTGKDMLKNNNPLTRLLLRATQGKVLQPKALTYIGNAFFKKDNKAEACRWYQKAADLGYPYAMNNLGSLLLSKKKYSEALTYYQNAAQLKSHPTFIYNVALAHEKLGQTDETHDCLLRAAQLGHKRAQEICKSKNRKSLP